MSADASGTPAARGRLRRGLLISAASLALLLCAAEIGLRVTRFRERRIESTVNRTNRRWVELLRANLFEPVPDAVRHYALRPGAEATVDGWHFRANRWRARGPDFPAEKPAGEKRLLCLGDSFAFGLWCDEDQTLVAHLARMANDAEAARASGLSWRPIDLGVPGYHSGQQLRSLEQDGLALAPDVVVLYYNTNDIESEGMFLDAELGALYSDHLPLPSGLKRTLWHSHAYGWLVHALERRWRAVPDSSFDPDVPWSHTCPENQAATRAAIARIAVLCRERGIGLFFVNQPLVSWSADARSERWRVLPLVQWAADLRAELELPGISLLGWLRGYADGRDRFGERGADGQPPPMDFVPEQYLADEAAQAYFAGARDVAVPTEPDFHFTGEGYAHIARLVYPEMRRAGLVP